MDASTLSKAWTASPLTQIWDSQSNSWATVSQVGADTVVDMGNGDQLVLANVQLSSLQPGWFFQA